MIVGCVARQPDPRIQRDGDRILSAEGKRHRGLLTPIVALLTTVVVVVGLGWAALHFFFAPNISRVDRDALAELRAIGQVVGEDSAIGHQWENSYVEFKEYVIHLDGGIRNDLLVEAERRLGRSGWRVRDREPETIHLQSARWPGVFVTAERFEDSGYVSDELRKAAEAAGVPPDTVVFITAYG